MPKLKRESGAERATDFVESLDRGLRLLQAFGDTSGPMTLSDVARAVRRSDGSPLVLDFVGDSGSATVSLPLRPELQVTSVERERGVYAAVEHLLGYRISRVHVPGFSFHAPLDAGAEEGAREIVELPPTVQEQKASRGRRLGARSGKELTPEELAKLLKVG